MTYRHYLTLTGKLLVGSLLLLVFILIALA